MRLAPLLLLLVPVPGAPERLGVTIDEGETVTKTFSNRLRLELVDISIEVDGEDVSGPSGDLPKVVLADDEEIVFVDEYVTLEGGRATRILRTFETLEDTSEQTVTLPDGEEDGRTDAGESDLAGHTVVFEWDEDEAEYAVAFDAGERGDEELLEGLEGDADFLFLLPPDEPEVGDTWTLDGEVFARITSPGGDLKIRAEGDGDEEGEFSEEFADNLVGEIEATLESVEDGVAVVRLEGRVETEFELDVDEPDDAPDDLDLVEEFTVTFDLDGTLEWDVERGIARSLELSGEVEMQAAERRSLAGEDVVATQFFEGTFDAGARFE